MHRVKFVLIFVTYAFTFTFTSDTNVKEKVVHIVQGINKNVMIRCDLNEKLGPVVWMINNSIYDFSDGLITYPCIEKVNSSTIQIVVSKLCLNDATFQCAISALHLRGIITRVVATNDPFNIANNYLDDGLAAYSTYCIDQSDELEIDTQTLIIDENNYTSFNFTYPQSCIGSEFHLLVINSNHLSTSRKIPLSLCSANISSSTILSSNNTLLELQLQSSIECQYVNHLYTIKNQPTIRIIFKSNEPVCIQIPTSSSTCNTSTLHLVLSSECSIIPQLFDGNFNKNYNCENWDLKYYNISINLVSQVACFYDWNQSFARTVVHFMCITYNINQFTVTNLISSYEMIADTWKIRTPIIPATYTTVPPDSPQSPVKLTEFIIVIGMVTFTSTVLLATVIVIVIIVKRKCCQCYPKRKHQQSYSIIETDSVNHNDDLIKTDSINQNDQ